MSIECGDVTCKHHGTHHGGEGPFCDEHFCNYQRLRFFGRLKICLRKWWRTPRKDRHSFKDCDWGN
jgi:hypothetical protein